jgi:hypothetical protein
MADIFVSYTSQDKQWAEWIGQRLLELGHIPHLHDWELVTDISAWMEERHDKADMVLCVVSGKYLKAPFSSWERRAAQWAVQSGREHFLRLVAIEDCEYPTLLATFKRCALYGLDEASAKRTLATFLATPGPPTAPITFPGVAKAPPVPFPVRPR